MDTRARGRRSVAVRMRLYWSRLEVHRARDVVLMSIFVLMRRSRKSWNVRGGDFTSWPQEVASRVRTRTSKVGWALAVVLVYFTRPSK